MIYLITCNKTKSCKIGFSNNPQNRLIQLQTGNPFPLELTSVIEGTIKDEQLLHKKFKNFKLAGEWFDYNEEIKDYFKVKEYVKVNILKDKITNETFLSLELFDTLGEVKILSYILQQINFKKDGLYNHSATRQKAIESKYGYSRATQNNYIKSLTNKNFVIKIGKGEYKVNEEMISLMS